MFDCYDPLLMLQDVLKNWVTLWQTNMAMENGPVEDVFPIETWGFSIAM